ncbi:nitronate monooxygenase [Paracoccus sp. DMF-8]|uniref:nitronate monooxygenase n=1 Tax=Paracoccus sp. DMF-8 TaxID=3019445 RepID=UPI0023E78F60|nr:nitronate monooxygenase [Paracoccus sp. DMF-8]MDF3604787.1 nitronate monooxygenase [Paracoccus sp. DMF-8]
MTDPFETPLCGQLGCAVPVLLAGMGGVARWELAAAVANAGGYAQLGMVREPPELIAAEITALRAATAKPFSVNIIPPRPNPACLTGRLAPVLIWVSKPLPFSGMSCPTSLRG